MYPNCFLTTHVAYAAPVLTQTVSLAAVPYTGLDLGPLGTALYFAFLAAWTLLGAYLIVVKRVQNTLAEKIQNWF